MYVAVYSQGYGDGPEHDGVFGPFTNEEKGKVWVRSYLNNVVGWDGLDQAPDFDWESTDLPFTYGGWHITEVIFVDEDADLGALVDEGDGVASCDICGGTTNHEHPTEYGALEFDGRDGSLEITEAEETAMIDEQDKIRLRERLIVGIDTYGVLTYGDAAELGIALPGVDFPSTVDPKAPYVAKYPVTEFVAWLNQSGLLGPDVHISIDMVDEYVLAAIEDRDLRTREDAIDEIVDTYESNFQEDDAYDLGYETNHG